MRQQFNVGDLFRFSEPIDSLSLASVTIPGRTGPEPIWLIREGNEEKSYWAMHVQYTIANKAAEAVELYGQMSTKLNNNEATVCFRSDLTMRPDHSFMGTVHVITQEALIKVLRQ